MKSLHFPINWASRMNHFVTALRRAGSVADGFALLSHFTQDTDALNKVYADQKDYICFGKWRQRFLKMRMMTRILYEIPKYDIIHWYAGAPIINVKKSVKFISLRRKPGLVQWQGDDIRDPEHAADSNPYYKLTLGRFPSQQIREISERNKRNQEIFYEHDFVPMASPDIIGYIPSEIGKRFVSRHALDVSGISPLYPAERIKKLKIAHAPSENIIKGTSYILRVLERLSQYFDFEFVLLQNMSHEEVLRRMRDCDLFVEQMFIGGYSLASLEAMALGKPSICYLTPEYESYLPMKCPIINANIDNLEEVLASILSNPECLHRQGKLSREYVEKVHSYEAVGPYLLDIYKQIIN